MKRLAFLNLDVPARPGVLLASPTRLVVRLVIRLGHAQAISATTWFVVTT
jgi:hypothetical protein